ncbi:hypothetical protein SEUCBS139899_003743 [Sporothrix eucalyptigena]|uniref:YCII-related domain-containing protein n=1 Tax=Sporothrix eucalyptigena TaxID=1812306 RepID=A0ABP0BPR8_9PEZI
MATPEWLIQVPVLPGTVDKRIQLRQQHFSDAKALIEKGVITFAGGILANATTDGDNKEMTVTLFTVSVPTLAEARQILERDVYTTEGIWDATKAEIFPFRTGVRAALGHA